MTHLSACLIVRDEAHTVEACLASIRPYVDELCVLDTGSVDDTPAIARRYADKLETFLDCNDDEGRIADFSLARNRSFALATNDVVFWLDGDDVVEGAENLPKLAREAARHENAQILLPYSYSHDDAGRSTLLQYRERILSPRRHFEWRFPVHESCLLAGGHGEVTSWRDDSVKLVHRDRSAKPREVGRNLRILQGYIDRVGEQDVRSLYYYGLELGMAAMRDYGAGNTQGFLHQTGASLRVLKRYVELAHWEDERCLAMLEIGRHYQRLNDHDEAIKWAARAMQTKSWPEPYWQLMRSYYSLARQDKRQERYHFRRAAHFGQLGMSINPDNATQSVLSQDPMERARAHEILSLCLGSIGDVNGAIASLEAGLKLMPEHELMQGNLAAYRIERSKRIVTEHVAELEQAGALDAGARTIIKGALNGDFSVQLLSVPTDMPDSAAGGAVFTDGERARLAPHDRPHHRAEDRALGAGKLDIIFFIGPGLEPWSGDTIGRTGLGGSETMAWELSRRLAARGHRVRLIGHCEHGAPAGVFGGVEFIDYRGWLSGPATQRACDILISSRRPELVDDGAGVTAGATFLWVHDVHCGDALTHKRNIRFDRILALSNWHRSFLRRCYPLVDPGKILVTRNGIDLTRFEGTEPRNARRAIYSSSPDRGLETLLDVWPIVRKSVPDAELHVFYGFDSWETAARNAPDIELKRIKYLREKMARTAGVRAHGRIGQAELAREFMRSGVWTYPTAFDETSCCTAMEAQAAGCRIVTCPQAALNETVGERGQLVAGFGTPGFVDTFAAAVVVAMRETMEARAVDDRALLKEHARNAFSLDSLAIDWEGLLGSTLDEVRTKVVPPFHKAGVV